MDNAMWTIVGFLLGVISSVLINATVRFQSSITEIARNMRSASVAVQRASNPKMAVEAIESAVDVQLFELKLQWQFDACRSVYERIQVIRSELEKLGNPVAGRTLLSEPSWNWRKIDLYAWSHVYLEQHALTISRLRPSWASIFSTTFPGLHTAQSKARYFYRLFTEHLETGASFEEIKNRSLF